MEFKKIEAPSLKELFVKELEAMILSGRLQVGDKLPSERVLAEQMGISRTIVNVGLSEVAAKGFIEIRPRVGIFVSDYRRNSTLATLVSIMSYNSGMMRREEIKSLIEMRMLMENFILNKVIPSITDEEIATLEHLIDDMAATTSPTETAERCYRFHHELCILSQNTFLPLFYSSSKGPICALWTRYCQLYGCEALIENTKTLFHFIKTRNLPGAWDASIRNLQESIDGSRQLYY